MSHSARTRSHAPNESAANRFKSNRARSTRDTWLCVRVISIYRGLSASLASSVRQYFTTINYYGRIDLTPNANTQITASLFRYLSLSLARPCMLYALFLFAIFLLAPTLFLSSPRVARRCTLIDFVTNEEYSTHPFLIREYFFHKR